MSRRDGQLFPREPKRMKQPRKAAIRWRMELAEAQLAYRSTPWWWRLWHRAYSRLRKPEPT